MTARLASSMILLAALMSFSGRPPLHAGTNDSGEFAAAFRPGETLGREAGAKTRDVLAGLRRARRDKGDVSSGLHVTGTPDVRFGGEAEPPRAVPETDVPELIRSTEEGWSPFLVPSDVQPIVLPGLPAGFGVVPTYFAWFHPLSESALLLAETSADHALRPEFPPAVLAAMQEIEGREDVAPALRRSVRAFAAGKYDEVDAQLRRTLPKSGNSGILRFARAHALFAKGDYDAASLEIRRGLDSLPEWVETGVGLAALYDDVEALEAQRGALVAHVLAKPKDGEALVVLAYVDFFSGRIDEAEATFRLLASERAGDPLAGHFLTEILRIRRAFERAGR